MTTTNTHPSQRRGLAVACTILTSLFLAVADASDTHTAAPAPSPSIASPFEVSRRQAAEFIRYDDAIVLDARQQQIMTEALSAIPAPCCAKFSLATCCCPCNLARSSWGLAKHAIVDQGAGVVEVRTRVEDWVRFIGGKNGHGGDACFTGGCIRPFADNGCGGMDAGQLH